MKSTACVIALAAGSGLALGAAPGLADPAPATVASDLQVNIVPPGTVTNDAIIPLDVKFRGGNIRIVELLIDGTRITRQALSTRDGHGVLHFTLDPSLLTEGSHEVLVKAYEGDGTCATSTTHMVVTSGDLNAIARFEFPKRNAEVQDVLQIKVKISDTIRNPYVTFNVDKDFLALRNYAPYTYNWDSRKVDNGVHSLSVQVIDGDTSEVIQTITTSINVKNILGFTKNMDAVKPEIHSPVSVPNILTDVAKSVDPNSRLDVQDVKAIGSSSATFNPGMKLGGNPGSVFRSIPGSAALRDLAPSTGTTARSVRPAGSFPVVKHDPMTARSIPTPNILPARGHAVGSAIASPDTAKPLIRPRTAYSMSPGIVANPSDLITPRSFKGLAHQSVHIRRQGGIALRPRMVMASARTTATAVGGRPVTPHLHRRLKTFDVAFNSSLINFDVPPRIENGLPLAPFRAIFEHTGGTVQWFNQSKVVRATNEGHEIEIHVGSKQAIVNSQPVTMEAIPYLDRGRTIVPLSFIRDALNVKVTFDPENGHLLIETTK